MTFRRPDEHDEVVRRACAGDDDALAELVLLYHDLVYRYGRAVCRDVDLDDAVQDTFVALARSRHQFRGDANISTWLFTTVRNACRQLLRPVARRRQNLGEQVDSSALDTVSSDDLGPEDRAIRNALVASVRDALAQLEPRDREILVLRDLDGLSGAATAAQLGISLAAMKSRLVRARAALRAQLIDSPVEHT